MGEQQFFTIGYQKLKVEAFIQLLVAAKVQTLYDIRSFPQSRVVPYNADPFRKKLNEAGIIYVWEPKLGGKIKHSAAVRIKHLPGPQHGNTALMCFEQDIKDCHRKEIAALIEQEKKVKVTDLSTPKSEAKWVQSLLL